LKQAYFEEQEQKKKFIKENEDQKLQIEKLSTELHEKQSLYLTVNDENN
jgi:hypothetical protein